MKKRILSMLVVLSLLLCMVPAVSAAAEGLTEEQQHYQDGCPGVKFQDMPGFSDWAHEGIDFCVGTGLMKGVSETVFSPGGTVSRAQLVTILYRMEGSPEVSEWYSEWRPYSDVPAGQWYSDAVLWATSENIVYGIGNGRFNPNGPVTREQIATILYRYSGSRFSAGSLSAFPDAGRVSEYAINAMVWATSEGLIKGVKTGNTSYLYPQASATRAQIAAIIMRYLADGSDFLEYWTFQELHGEFYKEMARLWNDANPDRPIKLKIKVLSYERMHSRLAETLAAGTDAPDMVDIEFGKSPDFLKGDIQLLPLNDIVEPELDNIVKARVDIYSKDGNYYGIDFHVGAAVIWYNKELCEAAGIDYTAIKTWDEFYNAAKKFKAAFPSKYWNSVESSDIWHMWGQLAELGADMTDKDGNITINTPEMAKVLTYNRKMVREGLAIVAPGTYHHAEEFYEMMNEGNIASVAMPFWFIDRFTNYMPDLAGKIVIAPLPVWEAGQKRSVGQGGTATAVTNQANDPQLVKDFLAFCKLSKQGGVKLWQLCGFDPIRTDVWSMDDVTHDPKNTFVRYYANNPFDTLLQIKDEIVGVNNTEALPVALDTMKAAVLYRAYETNDDITTILAEEQANAEAEARK